MALVDLYRIECDTCAMRMMDIFESISAAETAARRAGWVCDLLGGDVLCQVCRKVELGIVLPITEKLDEQ